MVYQTYNAVPFTSYDGDQFLKEVDADFVVWELNGRTDFGYDATAAEASYRACIHWALVTLFPGFLIEWLHLSSLALKHPQHPPIYSISFVRMQGKKVVSSIVILETQAAWNLPSTIASIVSVLQLPY